MATRILLIVASLSFSVVACGRGHAPVPVEERASLGGDTVARVADTVISASLVADVARASGVGARAALSRIIDDALAAKGAQARQLDRVPDVARQITAARARQVIARIRKDAHAAGPPTDAEVVELSARHWRDVDLPEQMRVIHAAVLRPKELDSAAEKSARSLVAALDAAEVGATSDDDFEARAKTFPHPGFDLKVERLKPFVADGRIAEPGDDSGYDPAFSRAAAALSRPGETSGVVETPFGWHVIRLIERLPEKRVPFEQRRTMFGEEAFAARGRHAVGALETSLRQSTPVVLANGVEALMADAASAAIRAGTTAQSTEGP